MTLQSLDCVLLAHLIVHGVESVGCDNVASMNESIECTGRLCQVGVVRVVGSDPIQDEIEAIGKVGDAGSESIEIEAIFNVRAFDFAKHFVALETTEPKQSRRKR